MAKLTLRDKLAMSMPYESIAVLNHYAGEVAEGYGLEWSSDPAEQIKFFIQYQAIIRYQYADAMMSVR